MRPTPIIATTLLLFATPAVQADEGRIPISGSFTASSPGHYVLTKDVSGTIYVTSDDVVIDLNGRTVTPTAYYGVDIAVGATNVTVRNGTIHGGFSGVSYSNTSGTNPAHIVLEDLELVSQSQYGIYVYNNVVATGNNDVAVRRCHAWGSGSTGIYVYLTFARASIVVEDSATRGTGGGGIQISSGVVRRCTVAEFGTAAGIHAGIWVYAGGIVEGNLVSQTSGDDRGVYAGDGAIVRDNVVKGCGGDGIYSPGYGCRITGNSCSGNGGDGIESDGYRNLVEGNQLEGNAGCGIRFSGSTTHAYRSNMLRGNTGGTTCGSSATDAGGNIL